LNKKAYEKKLYETESIKHHYLLELGHEASSISAAVFMIKPLIKISERNLNVFCVYGMGDLFRGNVGKLEKYREKLKFIEKNNKINHEEFFNLSSTLNGLSASAHRDFDIGVCVNDAMDKDFIFEFSKILEHEYGSIIKQLDSQGLVNGHLRSEKGFNGFDYKDKGSWDREYVMNILKGEITKVSIPLKDLFFEKKGCLIYENDIGLSIAHKNFGIVGIENSLTVFENYLKGFVETYEKYKNEHENFGIYFNLAKKALEEIESLKQETS